MITYQQFRWKVSIFSVFKLFEQYQAVKKYLYILCCFYMLHIIKITWIQILTAVNWASITGIHAKIIMRPNPYTDFSSFVRIMIRIVLLKWHVCTCNIWLWWWPPLSQLNKGLHFFCFQIVSNVATILISSISTKT
jgi:hypothetical protein